MTERILSPSPLPIGLEGRNRGATAPPVASLSSRPSSRRATSQPPRQRHQYGLLAGSVTRQVAPRRNSSISPPSSARRATKASVAPARGRRYSRASNPASTRAPRSTLRAICQQGRSRHQHTRLVTGSQTDEKTKKIYKSEFNATCKSVATSRIHYQQLTDGFRGFLPIVSNVFNRLPTVSVKPYFEVDLAEGQFFRRGCCKCPQRFRDSPQ